MLPEWHDPQCVRPEPRVSARPQPYNSMVPSQKRISLELTPTGTIYKILGDLNPEGRSLS